MKTTIINHKRYTVAAVFNMVLNYEFTDKKGVVYLVDGEDVTEWAQEQGVNYDTSDGVTLAIEYAKYLSTESEDGVF